MLPHPVASYLKKRAFPGPWRIEGSADTAFAGTVVIPSLAESGNLFATLDSLGANPPEELGRFLVLVVVNHREDASAEEKADNGATLDRLAGYGKKRPEIRLAWVDAASPGRELPARGGGVGMARKIGLDLALARLDYRYGSPVLVCLDADTLVEPGYLAAIRRHFRVTDRGGAHLPFRHRPAATPEGQAAIDRYELFLRHYVLGLKVAGSPYAFPTVGSAMACTADAYVRAGGMNTRTAGEDFYFLQQLHRTGGVAPLTGTTVFPSPRASHRVPFGTGRAVSRALGPEGEIVSFYRPECFYLLRDWLRLAAAMTVADGPTALAAARKLSPHLAEYLDHCGLPRAWEQLRRNHPDPVRFGTAFHGWFDGLRTLRLVHHLSAGPFPRCEPDETVPELLRQAGLEPVAGVKAQLELLRCVQSVSVSDE